MTTLLVLHYLSEHDGRAVAREALIRDVWDYKYDVGSNVVEAVVKTLRKKLGGTCGSDRDRRWLWL